MIRAALIAAALALPALPMPVLAQADLEARADARVFELIEGERMIGLMRAEGLAYGETLAADLLGRPADAAWAQAMARIYDLPRMRARFEGALGGALTAEEAAPILAFLEGDLGRRIVELELAAREAFADEEAEGAARAVWAEADAAGEARAAQIRRFIEANDLLEENVAAGLTANYEFLAGLAEGGGMPGLETTDDALIAQAYSAEPELRAESAEWLGGYLNLAYGPLSDAELDRYIDFSATPAGRDMNRALFRAFDAMYEGMSRAMGVAAGVRMAGEDI